jgi:hypothetical protein
MLDLGVEELLSPRPTPKLKMEDHSLSAARECLFNIFPVVLQAEVMRNPLGSPLILLSYIPEVTEEDSEDIWLVGGSVENLTR